MNIAAPQGGCWRAEVDEARERMPGSGHHCADPCVPRYPTVPNDRKPKHESGQEMATVGGATLGSRLFGLHPGNLHGRPRLGHRPGRRRFNTAFRLPNTFRRLFAEGAFNSAFVPLFAKEIEAHGMEGARRFSEEVFGVLFTVLLLLTIAMELAMPFIVGQLIAPGFADDPAKFTSTVTFATIMFPYLACMSLAAMMAGMLNSLHRYFAAAIAPVFLNFILIGVLAYAWYSGQDAVAVGYDLSWGCWPRASCNWRSSGSRCAMPGSASVFADPG